MRVPWFPTISSVWIVSFVLLLCGSDDFVPPAAGVRLTTLSLSQSAISGQSLRSQHGSRDHGSPAVSPINTQASCFASNLMYSRIAETALVETSLTRPFPLRPASLIQTAEEMCSDFQSPEDCRAKNKLNSGDDAPPQCAWCEYEPKPDQGPSGVCHECR